MSEIWFKKLGFYNNPFSVKPAVFHNNLFGYEEMVEKMLEKLEYGDVFFIEGDYGKGKTTILKSIVNRFGGKKKVIYYSCNRKEGALPVEDLLVGKTFLSRIFRSKMKDAILLLDEAQDLNGEDSQLITKHYDEGYLKSIVFVGKDMPKLSKELSNLIGKNVLKLKKISERDAIELIRKRVGNLEILTDEIIAHVYSKSDGNPRRLLSIIEDACRYVVDHNLDAVNKDIVNKVA